MVKSICYLRDNIQYTYTYIQYIYNSRIAGNGVALNCIVIFKNIFKVEKLSNIFKNIFKVEKLSAKMMKYPI